MNEAVETFALGVLWGFGLSILLYMLGSVIGHSMALFDVD